MEVNVAQIHDEDGIHSQKRRLTINLLLNEIENEVVLLSWEAILLSLNLAVTPYVRLIYEFDSSNGS